MSNGIPSSQSVAQPRRGPRELWNRVAMESSEGMLF